MQHIGWISHILKPYRQYWGNVNGDESVTMADANAVVNYYLATDKPEDFDVESADVNGDGGITMADAN
ncbi:MAG: hypothetical protein IKQ68_07035 [Prevotella sp.]|nr:hypothetical protein [Prevotella sp.]